MNRDTNSLDMRAQILAGVSGFRYAPWRGHFYPQGAAFRDMLEVYVSHFFTLEIRETYYGFIMPSTLGLWAEAVPEGFLFSLKVPRVLVFAEPGREMNDLWNRFLPALEPLKSRGVLGALLVQVPFCMERSSERLRAWLDTFGAEEADLAFDFKHPSWTDSKTTDLLIEGGADRAAVSRPGHSPFLEVLGKHKYIRLLGERRERNSDYSFKEIESWCDRILAAGEKAERIYVYFNNTGKGSAPVNAKTLLKMTSQQVD